MNKTLLTTFAVLFSFAVFFSCMSLASATGNLVLSGQTNSITVYQSSTATGTFTLTNTGDADINSIVYSASNLASGVTVSFSPVSPISLHPGNSAIVTFTVTASSSADLGDTTSNISITSSTNSTYFNVDITVKQRFCSNGPQGSRVNLDLNGPDSGEDFYPGQNITVDFNIDTNSDVDFTVEAELYDLTTKETISDDSLDDNLDNDNQDYSLYLDVPSDIDESDSYIVRVKAYEDSRESTQCDESYVSVDIKRETHQLTINKVTYPGLACGSTYNIGVKIENTGKKDEANVNVKISSASLNISNEQTRDIDKGDTATYTFTGTMPIVAPGTYSLRVDITSDSGSADTSDLYTLNLQTNCRTQKTDASITQVPGQNYLGQENTVIVTLTNTGDVSTSYTLDVSNLAWASIVSIQPSSLSLGPTESGNVYITFMPNANAASINSLPISIKSGTFSKTQTLQVTLQQKTSQGGNTGESAYESFLSAIRNNSWLFILNVALLIIIIVLIIIVATRAARSGRSSSYDEPKEARLKSNKKGRK